MAKEMREWILALDDTRAVTGAINLPVGEELNAAHALDVVGLNYQNQDYQRIHALFPEKCILGTENCPTFATRGVYQTDEKAQVFNSYGDHFAAFTVSIDETMQSVYENDFVAGCFPWSGFDSYGEPAPFEFPSVLSHWGFLDICGFEKDTAYLLSAYYQKELMLHLFPHWNWELNETVRVCAFTNADTVELFVNGESCGEVLVQNCRAEWQVKYAPGNICAVAKRGEETVASKRVTAGDAKKILLEDVTPTVENQTVKIVNVSVVDQNGTVLPACDKTICLDKAAELLGIANGNPNGTQDNVVYEIKLFHGHAQLIVTADSVVTVRCDGLDSETLS
jgi:beta-galactosidase